MNVYHYIRQLTDESMVTLDQVQKIVPARVLLLPVSTRPTIPRPKPLRAYSFYHRRQPSLHRTRLRSSPGIASDCRLATRGPRSPSANVDLPFVGPAPPRP
jgi:hypothetical protein